MLTELSLPGLVTLFVLSSALVVGAGVILAREADEIARRTGLGGLVVGMLLLAGATSLPEIMTNLSAAISGAPDLAVGSLFGSSMANMAILAVIDLVHRGRVWPRIGIAHARLASVAIALTSLALIGVVVPAEPAIGWVGAIPVVIVVAYAATVAWFHRSDGTERHARDGTDESIAPIGWGVAERRTRTPVVWLRFGGAAAVVLVAAPLLAVSTEGIAAATGIGQTFLGAALLALTTSLPELVASLAAVRIGAYDLAVGNLFGSNAFNMATLLAADLAYPAGPILGVVSATQAIAGAGAILLMALALAAVVHGEPTRLRRLEPDALLVLGSWVVLLGVIYGAGG